MDPSTGFTAMVTAATEAAGASLAAVGLGGGGHRGSRGHGGRGGPNGVSGRGLGIVVGADRVLTNAHNLRDRTTSVRFPDGRTAQARLVGLDADGDLAVLEVATEGAAAITWTDGEAPAVGAFVVALGFGTGGTLRATVGAVSAVEQTFRGPRGRRVRGAFEHTAPLARGSSGGPVLDHEGRLVGISTSRLGGGFYLALPADATLRERVDSLGRGEEVERVRLGVGLAPSSVSQRLRASVGLEPREGLLVQEVGEGSAAASAGLRTGDLLVALDGAPLNEAEDLLSVLDITRPGASLRLGVVRGAEEIEITVTFPPAPSEPAEAGG